jgi:predicted Zn-dependent protease
MRDYFYGLAAGLDSLLQGDEVYTCTFSGEESDFVRFNHNRVRQAGHVVQRELHLDLIAGRRHATGTLTLAGNLADDQPRLRRLVADLRATRAHVPDDPWLQYAVEVHSSEQIHADALPAREPMVGRVLTAAHGQDLVGILAAGAVHAGFANSFGQRNWSTRSSFNLDWSLYLRADKAVKSRYAGFEWHDAELQQRMDTAVVQLEALARPPRKLAPGRYRAWLAPPAVEEILDLLCWDGFGLRAHKTRTTPLLRMVEEGARLHPDFTLSENTRDGVAPDFQGAGFIRPPQVTLIDRGVYRDCLVSPRSAAEFGVPANGAEAGESPLSLDLAAGVLPAADALRHLDTGLYIGNLWYLNFSDRNAARMTGMTRFATFWVENGILQAPVNVLRFDESLYPLFGERLLGLSRERDFLLDPGTYGGRSSRSSRLPGLLVEAMTFTL